MAVAQQPTVSSEGNYGVQSPPLPATSFQSNSFTQIVPQPSAPSAHCADADDIGTFFPRLSFVNFEDKKIILRSTHI